MWKSCMTLVLLICIQVGAHGPMRPRVGGGADARVGAWPWMVSLHDPTSHFCGGTLISNEWVLSAAHCFIGPGYTVTLGNIRVYLGRLAQRGVNNNQFKIMTTVRRIHFHDLYNIIPHDNDIALLHLSSPVTYNAHIGPVRLTATGSDFPPGTASTIIGWGKILSGDNPPYPGTLQEAVVPVVDQTVCRITLGTTLTNNMICAGFSCGGVDANYGDSGGPLMSQYNFNWVQHGIVSWGKGCGQPNTPGVYTRVSQYEQWIRDTITDNLPEFDNVNLPPPIPPRQGQQGQRQG